MGLPDAYRRGAKLLHEAAAYHSDECARKILEKGGDVNAVDIKGMTPLHYSAANGSVQVTGILVQAGAVLRLVINSVKSLFGRRHSMPVATRRSLVF